MGAVGAVFLALREADERGIAEFFAGGADAFGADQGGAPGGHNSFRLLVVAVEKIRGDELQNGVAEELQALVVFLDTGAMFVDVAAVSEGGD